MAVTITWNDGTQSSWDDAELVEQKHPRGPYLLYNEKGDLLAMVPDFDVRYVGDVPSKTS